MFVPSAMGAMASTTSADNLPTEPVRHMLFGSPGAVQVTIQQLHKLGLC